MAKKKRVRFRLPNDAKFVRRHGSRLSQAQAEVLGPLLVRLSNQYGGITRELIHDLAMDPDSPLHPVIFDCPRTVAAERYYLRNASRLMTNIEIDYCADARSGRRARVILMHFVEPSLVPAPVITADTLGADPEVEVAEEELQTGGGRYINIAQATEDGPHVDAILQRARNAAANYRKQFQILQRLAPTFRGTRRQLWNDIRNMF